AHSCPGSLALGDLSTIRYDDDMNHRTTRRLVLALLLLSSLAVVVATPSLFGAGPTSRPTPNDPAALVPNPHFRGGPASAADIAKIATLNALPPYAAKAGDGDFLLNPPYANAPEQTPRVDVPKGRIERFTMAAVDSKFYPDTG